MYSFSLDKSCSITGIRTMLNNKIDITCCILAKLDVNETAQRVGKKKVRRASSITPNEYSLTSLRISFICSACNIILYGDIALRTYAIYCFHHKARLNKYQSFEAYS